MIAQKQASGLEVKEPVRKAKRRVIDKEKRNAQWEVLVDTYYAGAKPGMANRFMMMVDGISVELYPEQARMHFIQGENVWIDQAPHITCETYYAQLNRYKQTIAELADLNGEIVDFIEGNIPKGKSREELRRALTIRGKNLTQFAVTAISDAERSIRIHEENQEGVEHVELDD